MGARPDTWMPMYWGDYARDTGHLNAEGHGAYLMLIKHYWCTGSPLADDDDELWRVACCDSKKDWIRLRPRLARLFQIANGTWHHKRVDHELAKALSLTDAKAEAGRKGAERRWQKNGTSVADPSISDRQNDAPSQPPSQEEAATSFQEEAARDRPRPNGQFHGFRGKMPTLNSPWSAWEALTDGEVEICGPNAQRRPCAGGFYVDEIARLVAEAAKFDGHTERIDWRPLVAWLRAGYDSEMILTTVRRVASKADYEPKTNLKYFTPALTDATGKATDR